MYAIKVNRQYAITEAEKASYVERGFDIVDDAGNILQAGAGKTVPYEKYAEALERIKALEVQKQEKPAGRKTNSVEG